MAKGKGRGGGTVTGSPSSGLTRTEAPQGSAPAERGKQKVEEPLLLGRL